MNICIECNKLFVQVGQYKNYCSDKCHTINWRRRNPDKVKLQRHRTYIKNKDRHLDQQRVWKFNNKDKVIDIRLKWKYGISKKDFDIMLLLQDNRCKICNTILIKPHLDHNHKTKQIRGILCQKCNLMIGHSQENIEILQSAIEYIKYYDNI